MDFRQLSAQIGTQAASGELKTSGGGGPLGSLSHNRGFSTLFHAASRKADSSRGEKPRAPQAQANDRPFATTQPVHRTLSGKADGSRGTNPRAPQTETSDKPSTTASAVHRAISRKDDGSTDAESRAPQAQTDDGPATTPVDVPVPLSRETFSGTDAESRAAQSETGDEPSTATSGSEALLLSLLGASIVTPVSTVASTQEAGSTDVSTSQGDELSGISGAPTIQPIAQPVERITSPVQSAPERDDLAGHSTTPANGDASAAFFSSMPEPLTDSTGTDRVTPVIEKSDSSQLPTVGQDQEGESSGPHQKLPLMAHLKESLPQALVPSAQVSANGQGPAQLAATVTTQPTDQTGEEVIVQPDRSSAQQILGKGEPSLHQKNLPTESSEPQAAATLSGHSQAGGQGFSTESDGQRKGEGLKWFSHADLQSAEVSSRTPQQSTVEPLDAGRQSLPYQQGQGGTPSSIQSVPTPTVPSSSQANRLSPDPETVPAALTHSVQFDLAPADFGQLRVRVVLSDHTIHTHMSTDRAELGQMLTGQQEQLSTQLTAAGLDLGRFQVQVDQERTNHSGQEWSSQPHSGTSQQQRDSRSQDRPQDAPVPSETRTGILNFFA